MRIKHKLEEYVNALREAGILSYADVRAELMDTFIDCVSYDTRTLFGTSLFICKGAHFREEFLETAVQGGAAAYVAESVHKTDAPYIIVSDIRYAMVILGRLHFDSVTDKIETIGITGTKGKTTTAYYVKNIMDKWLASKGEKPCAMLSSVENYDGVSTEESHLTTPEVLELYQHFQNAYDSGITELVMEVSSQALKYGRVRGMHFAVGCFTNIGTDHIGPAEHIDFEDYFSSKLKLFDMCDVACVNTDDERSDRVIERVKSHGDFCKLITYGSHPEDTVYCEKIEKRDDGLYFTVKSDLYNGEFSITMPGLFNVSNALCAISIAYALCIPQEFVAEGLRTARAKGRMLVFETKDKQVTAIVDYAHNKMSFEALYNSTKKEYPDKKIISIFGAPGNKAPGRRRELGEVSSVNSDYVFITEDDPAEERFMDIAKTVEQYVKCPHEILEDRGECIKRAILSHDGPRVLLVMGKGEEDVMKRGLKQVPCVSDPENVKRYIAEYDEGEKRHGN